VNIEPGYEGGMQTRREVLRDAHLEEREPPA
jgi:hypothetical protein